MASLGLRAWPLCAMDGMLARVQVSKFRVGFLPFPTKFPCAVAHTSMLLLRSANLAGVKV